MKKLLSTGLAMLGFCAFLQAQLAPVPMAGENLYTYKARMDSYFAPDLKRDPRIIEDEGSAYNEYQRFMTYWEPRLSPHGDFTKYFESEALFFRGGGGRSLGNTDEWQEIGPIEKPISNSGVEGTGPTEFIRFSPSSPSKMLCGSNPGGLFYSSNSGVTWNKTGTDTQIGRSGVGTAVFHPTVPSTWFAASSGNAGGGEAMWVGATGGVFRTTDAGVTWSQIAIESQIGGIWNRLFKMEINPSNPNRLWLATAGGLYYTNNALAASPTWSSVPALSGKYLYDLELRPGNANWMYVTAADAYNANGQPITWHYWYSSNGGGTWQIVPNEPANTSSMAKLTIEVSPADADNLYAVSCQFSGTSTLHFLDFGTSSWTTVYSSAFINMGGGHSFGVDPFNPNEIFLSQGTEGRRYTYGPPTTFIGYASSYSLPGSYHPDIEDLIPHPTNANEVWMCHHGGVSQSTDNGVTWMDRSTGLGVAQTTGMYTSDTDPGYVALGLYHDGTIVTNSAWYDPWAPTWRAYQGAFCDGMQPLIDHQTAQYQWHSCQWGAWQMSSNYGVNFGSNGISSPSWIVRSALNKLDSKIQYRVGTSGGFQEIYRTFDRFSTNAVISDFDAIVNVPGLDHYILWKVFTPENNGDYLIVHLRTYYTNGTEEDRLFRTKFANDPSPANVIASWEELPVPRNSWMSDVDFDLDDPNINYITYGSSINTSSSPTGDDMVFRVDYTIPSLSTYNTCVVGVCEDLTQNLPNGSAGGDALAVERGSDRGLYIATDYGVWFSNEASRSTLAGWSQLGTNLPYVGYGGIFINYQANKVRVGSFGRGAWEHDLYCPSTLTYVESGTYSTDTYLEAYQTITSTATVPNPLKVTYRAGEYVLLQPGFEADYGSTFYAFIHPCDRPYSNSPSMRQRGPEGEADAGGSENPSSGEAIATEGETQSLWSTPTELRVYPNPTSGAFDVMMIGLKPDETWDLRITNLAGQILIAKDRLEGPVQMELPPGSAAGCYILQARANGQWQNRKLMLR
jgi:hypothetical protein